jgi:heat shock protein 1/8
VCTFEVDANGLLKVSALDRTSGRKANITITNSVGRLSSTEIDNMIRDAETFKQADKDFTAKHEAKQTMEALISQVESTLSEMSSKLKRGPKISVEAELAKALECLEIEGELLLSDSICDPLLTLQPHLQTPLPIN